MVLQSGRTVTWMRTAHWLITVPVLLSQISEIAHVRYHGVNLSTLQVCPPPTLEDKSFNLKLSGEEVQTFWQGSLLHE